MVRIWAIEMQDSNIESVASVIFMNVVVWFHLFPFIVGKKSTQLGLANIQHFQNYFLKENFVIVIER